ncbi:MAG: NADH-quinone oxidoreductase subunit M [Candidatus Kapabacteria bacterium]|jgi:NADH-quinone oxidoreductase subunit M|nr:NADH-quinone oxidoreductase subunit M [Candidatus Kapabacteria bacterium]
MRLASVRTARKITVFTLINHIPIPFMLLATLFAPLVGALALLLVSRDAKKALKYSSLLVSLITFVFGLVALLQFDRSNPNMQMLTSQAWIPSLDAGFRIGVDGMSVLFVFLTTLTMPVVILAGFDSIKEHEKEFYALILLLEFGVIGIFAALDTFLFYVFFELILIPMYFLIGIWGGERRAFAAIKFFIYTMFGSLVMLVALIWLGYYVQQTTGHFTTNLLLLREIAPTIPLETQKWMFFAFMLAFCIKVPLFPVHTWLPDVQSESPLVATVVVGAVLFKIGIYGLIRFGLEMFPQSSLEYAKVMCTLGAIAVVYGALVAIVQTDMRRLASYALVSSLGTMVMGVFSMTPEGVQGAILQTFNHGLSVTGLFLCLGVLTEQRGTTNLADYGGVAKVMPMFAVLFAISMFSLAGLPGLNGFIGEYLLLLGTFRSPFLNNWVYGIVGATTGTFVAMYMLKLYNNVCFGKTPNEESASMKDLTTKELATLIPATILMIWIGVYPSTFMRFSEESTKALVGKLEIIKFGTTKHTDTLKKLHAAPHEGAAHNSAAQSGSGH